MGVIIDSELVWKDHTSFVFTNAAGGIGAIIKFHKYSAVNAWKFSEKGCDNYSWCLSQISFRAIVYYIEVIEYRKYL